MEQFVQVLDDAIVRGRLPNELGGCVHWQKCYAVVLSGVNLRGGSPEQLELAIPAEPS
jgi:hypothetical protein